LNPFKNKKIRSCYDKTSNKRWFSVVDVIALLRDCDYNTARNYWKWLKRKLYVQKNQLVSDATNQLQMQAADGKLRYTDVMDTNDILQLVELLPCKKATVFKLWLISLVKESNKLVNHAEESLGALKDTVRCKVGNLLKTLRRKEFNIFDEFESYPDMQMKEAAW